MYRKKFLIIIDITVNLFNLIYIRVFMIQFDNKASSLYVCNRNPLHLHFNMHLTIQQL